MLIKNIQELACWVRNNWRPYSTDPETKPIIKVNAIDVVWQTQKAAVEDELKKILEVTELASNDPRCFQQRTAAAKRVLENMTERERAAIKATVEERRLQGNPVTIQREYVYVLIPWAERVVTDDSAGGLLNIVKNISKLFPRSVG
jgi:hypothetical protein